MQVAWVSAVNDRRIASFRYRLEAPTAGLRARGHSVELFDPTRADQYDVVVFSKAYSAAHRALAKDVKRRGGRVVFDLCDNHFYNPFGLSKYQSARQDMTEMLALADQVICSTRTLASVVREETGGAVEPVVVGDIVERARPARRQRKAADPLRLLWYGSHGSPNAPSGMTDLLLIRKELEALSAKFPVELTVCSNSREKFDAAIAPMQLPTRYVEWSLEGFPQVLADTDAAILPMDVNPFTACKTHNRLTTALYAGVPVVASSIESYQEFGGFCTLENWREGLQALVERPEEQAARALSSREHIDERWTIGALASQWESALALPTSTVSHNDMRVHGRLDAVAKGSVTGWVRPVSGSDERLRVVLECDGDPVAVSVADLPREDLEQAGLGACGFSLSLPPRLLHANDSTVTVRVLETGWVVGSNPIILSSRGSTMAEPAPAPVEPQRWDMADSIRAQEQMLLELQRERAAATTARIRSTRKALGFEHAASTDLDTSLDEPSARRLFRPDNDFQAAR